MRMLYTALAAFFVGLTLAWVHAQREHAQALQRAEVRYQRQRERCRQACNMLDDVWLRTQDDDVHALVTRASILLALHPDIDWP
jgi:hypothetical protein